jgi:hypothetical protein
MMKVDPRRIRIGIEVSGQINWYERDPVTGRSLNIKVSGTKFANPLQNECTATISGLSTRTRDYILTETSPFNSNRTPKRLIVEAGRISTGVFRLFIGDINSAEPSSPPDVNVVLKAKTQSAQAGNIVAVSGQALAKLSAVSQRVAQEIGMGLDFQAMDKNISNFSFTGAALKMVDLLQQAGNVRAFIDDESLIVKDYGKALTNRIKILNIDSGLVGIPKPTEKGADLTWLIDSESLLGGMVRLESKFNKPMNGDYVIDQLKFDIASHDDPFFYIGICSRYGYEPPKPKAK